MLIKTESLKSLFQQYGDQSIAEIVAEGNSMYSSLPQDSFRQFSWAEIKRVKYATINYMTSTKCSILLDFVSGINGIQSEFVFIYAFCLGRLHQESDRNKVLPALAKVFASSSEHHVMEPGSVMNGWTWHDLSLLSILVRPTLHSSTIDLSLIEMLIDSITESGFDCANFSVPEDRERVFCSIIERWGTIDSFNKRVLATIGSALELAQVCLTALLLPPPLLLLPLLLLPPLQLLL